MQKTFLLKHSKLRLECFINGKTRKTLFSIDGDTGGTYIYQNDQKYRKDLEIPERTKICNGKGFRYSLWILKWLLWHIIWTASSGFGTYRICEQRRFRRACASAQSRQNLRCSLIQAVNQEELSNRKPDPWPLWMAGHAQLKFDHDGMLEDTNSLDGAHIITELKVKDKTSSVAKQIPLIMVLWPLSCHYVGEIKGL